MFTEPSPLIAGPVVPRLRRTPHQRDRFMSMLAELSMAFLWGLVIAYGTWWCWFGAWFWGQRFLMVACFPASFALARHLSHGRRTHIVVTLLTVAAVVWSVWVGVNGTVIKEVEVQPCMANDFNLESICWYIPEFSPLIHPLIKPKILTSWDKVEVLLGALVAITLVVSMLWARLRNYAVRLLSQRG